MPESSVAAHERLGRLLEPDRTVVAVFAISFGVLLLRLLLLFPPFLGDPMPLYEPLLTPLFVTIEFATGLVGISSRLGDGVAFGLLIAYFYLVSVVFVRTIEFALTRLQATD